MTMRVRNLLLAAMAATVLPVVAADRIPIANEGAIGGRWVPVPGTMFTPAYPDAYAKDPEQVCVAVGYLLNADGHTSDFSLLKSWSSGDSSKARMKFWQTFAGDASQALARWQFVPAAGVAEPKPVYTVATFVFGPGDSTATQEHCAISDLAMRLVELRYNERAGRLMGRGIYAKLDIDPSLETRLRLQAMADREREERAQAARNTKTPQSSQVELLNGTSGKK
ncbi:MAG: hypothetical protein QM599_09435 [Pseudoxanthomonas sp.]